MLGIQPTTSSVAASSGRAPVHRQTSGLFPTPRFLRESPARTNVFGGISSEGSHGWVVSERELFVYELFASEEGPRRKAELALDLQEDEERVEKFLCVKEVIIRGESFLAASTRELHDGDSSLLLFDLRSCKVCTTIKLPYSASAILQLDDLTGKALQHQDSVLAQFASILILGTTGGHLLAIDLDFVQHRQEVREMELHIANKDDYDPARFSEDYPNYIPCVPLNREHHQGGRFGYHQDLGDMILLPEKAVHITSLAYAPEFQALAVGFNFGTFQLWSLSAERILYSSSIGEGGLATKIPVSHFLFQSDQDTDLNGHAYLWIGRGSICSPLHSPSSSAEVQLFSVKFKNGAISHINSDYKKVLSGAAQNAAKIIDIVLLKSREQTDEEEESDDATEVGGTDWDPDAAPLEREETNPWILFVWEVQSTDGSNRLHMGLFNLDLVSVTSGFVPLAYPFQKENACLALWVDSTSITNAFACTKGLLPREREIYLGYAKTQILPISFDVSCLYVDTYTQCTWLGDQEKALHVFGQPLLPWVDPSLGLQTTYQECKNAGLLLNLGESSDSEREYRFQYKALFDMCLRLQLSSAICHLTTLTKDDGVTYLLANPRVVLDWAWERYLSLETTIYDHGGMHYIATLSGSKREAEAFNESLRILSGRIWGLQHVFGALLSRRDNTDKGQKNLEEKYQRLVHTLQHLKMMLWIREKIENWLFLGDAQRMADEFQERRERRRELHVESQRRLVGQAEHVEDDTNTRLFIELLLTAFPGAELYYPPRNLSDFLKNLFTASSHPEPLKHAIVYYYLRDLAGWGMVKSSLLEDYARRFHLPAPYARLVEGLWGLDHGQKEDIPVAWKNLTEVSGEAARILEDWNGRILRQLYDMGMLSQALHFLRWQQPPAVEPIDAILHMQILLQNNLLSQAFNYQRMHLASTSTTLSSVRKTLLEHIFSFFLAAGRMNELFKFHLDKPEEDALVRFLTAKAKGPGLEQLIHFFLQRGRYVEAIRAYDELKSSPVPLLPPERGAFLDYLIQNYKMALPSVALKPPQSLWPSATTSPSTTSSSSTISIPPTSQDKSSDTARILIPASPFGAPPSLNTPQRGWRSNKDDAMERDRESSASTASSRSIISPTKRAASLSPYAPAAPRPGVFGGALSSPVVSSPRASMASPMVSNQLTSPLLPVFPSVPETPIPASAAPEEELLRTTPVPTAKRRLAKRTKRGATPIPASSSSSAAGGPRTRSRTAALGS